MSVVDTPEVRTPTPEPQPPSIGRIVHYILESGPKAGEHRPAIIVNVWQTGEKPLLGNAVQLQVFTDSSIEESFNDCLPPVMWKTSRSYADPAEQAPGTWHWPDRV